MNENKKNASFSVRKVNVCTLLGTIRTAYFNKNIHDNKTDEKQVTRGTN